ncbi:DUF222 domain-containing protein [Jannaschia sp. R86511]|uniref:HNH endonuclease signature motif containing protein n=1 Tax=Jannaschia sp. R86511 TaxID=3093853 RepID=UPI0036D392BC
MIDLGDLPPLLHRLGAAATVAVSDDALVETMAAAGALACWAEAMVLETTARLRDLRLATQTELAQELGGWDAVADRGGPCDGDEVDRFTAVEVAAALGLSTRTARDRVGLAVDVVTRQPVLLAAMRAGTVSVAHARAVRDALDPVTDDTVAAAVVSGVVAERTEQAEQHGVPERLGVLGTPAELAAHVRRDAARAGVDAATRCRAARARRRLTSWGLPDGMAALQVTGPAVTIAAAVAAVDHRARDAVDAARSAVARDAAAPGGEEDDRREVPTLDQARVDVVLQSLTGSPDLERQPGIVGLDVTVLVPVDVLTSVAATGTRSDDATSDPSGTAGTDRTAGADRSRPGRTKVTGPPAELAGLGPLPDVVARAVVASTRRLRVVPLDERGHVVTPCSAPPDGAFPGSRPPDSGPPGSAAPGSGPPDSSSPAVRPDPGGGSDSRSGSSAGVAHGSGERVDHEPGHAGDHACDGDHEGAGTYRPGAALERAVKARDVTCRWPGCRARAARCDLDHTSPFPVGLTSACNLACLCRLHHRVKHRAGWIVLQGPFGRLDLVSPTGRLHVTEPGTWHRRRGPDPEPQGTVPG